MLGDLKQVSSLCLSLFSKNRNNSTCLVGLKYGFNKIFHITPPAPVQALAHSKSSRRLVAACTEKNLEKEIEIKQI